MTFTDPRIVAVGTNKMNGIPGSMATHVAAVVTTYDAVVSILKKWIKKQLSFCFVYVSQFKA